MVAAAEKWGHHKEVLEVHIVEVLVPMRNLCDSPNYGCKYYHMVNSSIGLYSPSWTYVGFYFSLQVAATAMEGSCNPLLT